MMSCYTGARGISKTHMLSSLITKEKKRGSLVISNMWHAQADIVLAKNDVGAIFDVIKEVLVFKHKGFEPVDLNPRFKHSGIFIVIDEAHLFFSADTWKKYSEGEYGYIINFLSQARKIDVHVVLSTQDPSKIDKNWRRYTESFYELKPVIPLRYFRKIKHPTKNCYTRNMRYIIPIAYVIEHQLRSENPYYSNLPYDHPTGMGTIVSTRFHLFGWLNPGPYKNYDSKELVGVDASDLVDSFPILNTYKEVTMPRNRLLTALLTPVPYTPRLFIDSSVSGASVR